MNMYKKYKIILTKRLFCVIINKNKLIKGGALIMCTEIIQYWLDAISKFLELFK